jgi:hypothetical protein
LNSRERKGHQREEKKSQTSTRISNLRAAGLFSFSLSLEKEKNAWSIHVALEFPSLSLSLSLSFSLLMLQAEFSMEGGIFTRCQGRKLCLIKSRVLLSA